MSDDPVTLGELGRRIERGFSDLKDDLNEMGNRLDKKVSQDVYEVRHAAALARIEALEIAASAAARQRIADREAVEQQRIADRRWRIAGVVIPVTLAVVMVITSVAIALVG